MRDSNPSSGSGTYASLISDIAGQVEYILGYVLAERGRSRSSPLCTRRCSWAWSRSPASGGWTPASRSWEEVAAHLVNLAWNGLSKLDPNPHLSPEAMKRLGDEQA